MSIKTAGSKKSRIKSKPMLREWSDEKFRRAYDCDRFTATILGNKLNYAVQHMSTGLMFNAFSPIIRDWYDFCITISGPPDLGYPMVSVSASLVVFLGTMPDAVRNAVEEYGPTKLKPGDVLVCNDPYRVGNHVNDVCFIRPVFHKKKIIAFVNVRAHQLDMGGVTPGGFSGTKKNVYENGMVLGPMLIFENDKPVRSTISLIFDNTRFPTLLFPDFMSTFRQVQLGEKLILESISRYGVDAYKGTIRYLCDSSEESMKGSLNALPNGTYLAEGGIDGDGIDTTENYTVRATITKYNENIEVDLSGTSRQARTCINAGPLDAKTAIVTALKLMFDPHSTITSGTFRNIDIVVPPGSILSAMPPDGAIMLYWEVTHALLLAIMESIGKVLGKNSVGGDYGSVAVHNAHGVLPDGTPWQSIAEAGGEHGPWGASQFNDGESYAFTYQVNGIDPPTESIEQNSPMLLLRKEYGKDTGGAGYNRGGAAVRRDALWLTDATHINVPLQFRRASGFGTHNGKSGAQGAAWLFDSDCINESLYPGRILASEDLDYSKSTPIAGVLDKKTKALDPEGEYHHFARQITWSTTAKAVSRVITNGGGGWGKPLEREPDRVLADVRNDYISIERALSDYGVVVIGDPELDPEGLQINESATNAARKGTSQN